MGESYLPRKEAFDKMHMAVKKLIADEAKKNKWTVAEVSLGVSMALGSFIKYTCESDAIPLSIEDHQEMCIGVLKLMCGQDPGIPDVKKWMH